MHKHTQVWTRNCTEEEYTCTNGVCIPQVGVCDGTDDCGDASDEEDCAEKECPVGRQKCADGVLCRDKTVFCDRYRDCPDASDESDCEEVRHPE